MILEIECIFSVSLLQVLLGCPWSSLRRGSSPWWAYPLGQKQPAVFCSWASLTPPTHICLLCWAQVKTHLFLWTYLDQIKVPWAFHMRQQHWAGLRLSAGPRRGVYSQFPEWLWEVSNIFVFSVPYRLSSNTAEITLPGACWLFLVQKLYKPFGL